MKIIIVNHSSAIFGAERSMMHTVQRLKEKFHFSLVSPPGPLQKYFCKCGGKEKISLPIRALHRNIKRPYQFISQVCRWLFVSFCIVAIVYRERPKLLHANGNQAMVYCILTAVLSQVPVIWHVRDVPRENRLIERICMKFAHTIICPSEKLKEHFYGKAVSMILIRNLIFSSEDKMRLKTAVSQQSNDNLRFAVIGQFIQRKGQDLSIEAFLRFHSFFPKSKLYLIGEESNLANADYVLRIKRQVLSYPSLINHVDFIEYCDDVDKWYQQVDIILIPSHEEALGRVYWEAAAFGLPVIAARTGGLAESIQDEKTGLLFKPGDAVDLLEKMMLLAENADLRIKIAEKAIEQYLHYEKHAEQDCENLANLYRNIILKEN